MPTYDYVCDACKHQLELFQSILAAPEKKCPECGKKKLRRLISPGATILFKGSGFYTTDYRSPAYKKAAAAEKSASGTNGSGTNGSGTNGSGTNGSGTNGSGSDGQTKDSSAKGKSTPKASKKAE